MNTITPFPRIFLALFPVFELNNTLFYSVTSYAINDLSPLHIIPPYPRHRSFYRDSKRIAMIEPLPRDITLLVFVAPPFSSIPPAFDICVW